jgi:hypothetical protein
MPVTLSTLSPATLSTLSTLKTTEIFDDTPFAPGLERRVGQNLRRFQ